MSARRPDITPELTVDELLAHYPELEDTLVDAAPPFAKLRNPMLRRTVARVTSLRQAAAVGGVAVGELVGRLRAAAGLDAAEADARHRSGDDEAEVRSSAGPRPAWVHTARPVVTYDARAEIEAGEMPLPRVMAAAKELPAGAVLVLVTPFRPAPIIERLRAAGWETWTEQNGPREVRTHCRKAEAEGR